MATIKGIDIDYGAAGVKMAFSQEFKVQAQQASNF